MREALSYYRIICMIVITSNSKSHYEKIYTNVSMKFSCKCFLKTCIFRTCLRQFLVWSFLTRTCYLPENSYLKFQKTINFNENITLKVENFTVQTNFFGFPYIWLISPKLKVRFRIFLDASNFYRKLMALLISSINPKCSSYAGHNLSQK